MRHFASILFLFIVSILAMMSVSVAQTSELRTCPRVELTAPADGAALSKDDRIPFAWSTEPRGTMSRDWVTVRLDDSASFDDARHAKAERGLHRAFARGRAGTYAWAVIFYDAKGAAICISAPRTYAVGDEGFAAGGSAGATGANLALRRYIIVLTGGTGSTFGGGTADRYVASQNYDDDIDADDWKARGFTGLEIYGDARNNVIKGSSLSDIIRGGDESCAVMGGLIMYCGAGDKLDGGDGDDIIHGGDEHCQVVNSVFSACDATDEIKGGKGNDTIFGGDESCTVTGGGASNCSLRGDRISGGDGNDTIHGGKGRDTISGDDGSDIVNGDDDEDNITGNFAGDVDDFDVDVVTGGNGNDIVNSQGDIANP